LTFRFQYGISSFNKLPETKYDAVILAVAHKNFESLSLEHIKKEESVVYDVKAVLPKDVVDGRL
jgi:UDP-N-acetyl-D-galactosamine dehydrogenase